MDQSKEAKVLSLKRSLGDLLAGPLGAEIPCIADLRKLHASISSELEDALAEKQELRKGDTDVEARKKDVKKRETSLSAARDRLNSFELRLGEVICVAHEKESIGALHGLDETLATRSALATLRRDYDSLAPAANAGLWAKGKAAAQRVVVSGKILLQEGKCNDSQKALARAARKDARLRELSDADLRAAFDAVDDCSRNIESLTADLSEAKAKQEESEKRCKQIEATDAKLKAIKSRAEESKAEMAAAVLSYTAGTAGDSIHADIAALCKELSNLETALASSEQAVSEKKASAASNTKMADVAGLGSLQVKAQKAISEVLEPDEQILVAHPGEDAALVATDRRVLITKWGILTGSMFGSQLNSWDWAHITGIEQRKGLTSKCIVVQTAGGQVVTGFGRHDNGPQSVWKATNALFVTGDCAETVAILRRKVADHHAASGAARSAPPTSGPAEEIRKFAALRDEGLISEEEFQAKKRALLGL
jgi:predicted nuclease with TOPRIM domain